MSVSNTNDPLLCQVNLAHCRYPLEHEAMADFVNALDDINRLAEIQEGFVWRFKSAESREKSPWPDNVLPNMSVWRDLDSLKHYVYRTKHVDFIRRKKEWFNRAKGAYQALWWVPHGHIPTLLEAQEKLDLLDKQGPTSQAFTFARHFAPQLKTGTDIGAL